MIRASQEPEESSPGEQSPTALFQQMDRDHSGTLDFDEFSRVFAQFNPSATMDDMRKLFDDADSDGNGSLDHDEVSYACQMRFESLNCISSPNLYNSPNLILYTLYLHSFVRLYKSS